MSGDLNRATIIGRLGADPELRYMQNGKAVANIRIATSERWTKDGEKQERTEWHSVTAYDKLAEIIGQYLRKGSQVYIEGRLQTRKWQAKDGTDRYTTEIIASQMQMLGGKRDAETRQAREENQSAAQEPKQQTADDGGFSDDIPF